MAALDKKRTTQMAEARSANALSVTLKREQSKLRMQDHQENYHTEQLVKVGFMPSLTSLCGIEREEGKSYWEA